MHRAARGFVAFAFLAGLMAPPVAPVAWGQGALRRHFGGNLNDRLGFAVSGAGDVDQDGVPDYVIGASRMDVGDVDTGSVFVHSGATGALLLRFDGTGKYDQLGYAVTGAGDVNNDGFADVAAGAPDHDGGAENAGLVRVFSGFDGSVLHAFVGQAEVDWLGRAVAAAGDLDGDGFADVLGGAPFADGAAEDAGRASIWSGATGAILFQFAGSTAGEGLGWSVAGAGDVDNDGFPDVVVGAPFHPLGGADRGRVRIYSGQDGSLIRALDGAAAGDQFGFAVSGAGDGDGDGFADVIAGAIGASVNAPDAGGAFLLAGVDGTVRFAWHGDELLDQMGYAVGGAGDVDDDGAPDVVVGVRYDDDGGAESGGARVHRGDTGVEIFRVAGDGPASFLGFAVAGAGGDLNGDGYDDLVAGAWGDDTVAAAAGEARVVGGTSCGGSAASYGAGCPGSGGLVPALGFSGCVSPGGFIAAEVAGGLPGAVTVLFMGVTQANVAMGAGCSVFVFPITQMYTTVLAPAGTGAFTGQIGYGSAPAVLYFQAFVLDPGGAKGYANSNGVALDIQH